jgi:membrane protein YdbS with pleckstrin-like domain
VAFLKKRWREVASFVVVCTTAWFFVDSAGLPGWAGSACGAIGCLIVAVSVSLRPKLGYFTSWAAAGVLTGSVFFMSGLFVAGDRIQNARAMGAAGVLTVGAVAALVIPPQLMRRVLRAARGRLRNKRGTKGRIVRERTASKNKGRT